ncbi:MAG: ead/Ea22-like family protein [Nocardioidaceae bacterium]|nr:MAG: ead/Ea22-like family protein [Nocardioidaceae bacterium]
MTDSITPERLSELREIASRAGVESPGPWSPDQWLDGMSPDLNWEVHYSTDAEDGILVAGQATEQSARHIAAFDPPTVLALLDALQYARDCDDRLSVQVDEYIDEVADLQQQLDEARKRIERAPADAFGAVIKAVVETEGDPTGHLPNCGYTEDDPTCGCAAFGERLGSTLLAALCGEGDV